MGRYLPFKILVIVMGLCFALSTAEAEFKIRSDRLTKGQVAFTYTHDGRSDIYLLDFKTRAVTPLVTTSGQDEYPTWSPDGSMLVFNSDRSGDMEIYRINRDGSGLIRLTYSLGVDEDPSWSSDGKQIVFSSGRGEGSNIYVMNADGSGQRALTDTSKRNAVPRWSPSRNEILYTSSSSWPGWDLFVVDPTTNRFEQLTSGVRTSCRGSWSPDGKMFSYSHGFGNNIQLYRQSKHGKDREKLTELPGKNYDSIWVDGETILFVRPVDPDTEHYQLHLLHIPSKRAEQLLETRGVVRNPTWFTG